MRTSFPHTTDLYTHSHSSRARILRAKRALLSLTVLLLTLSIPFSSNLSSARRTSAEAAFKTSSGEAISANWTNLYPDILKIDAVSTNNAWAIGSYGQLLHYTGGQTWEAVDFPNLRTRSFFDISMFSATNGWLAAGAYAFQYDGTNWVDRSAGLIAGVTEVQSVEAVGPNEAWAVGLTANGRALLHWNGANWNGEGPLLPPDAHMVGITMAGSGEGWANGEADSGGNWTGLLYRYTGTNWQQVSNPAGMATLRNVWASPDMPGQAWLSAGDFDYPGVVYHYNNGTWTPHFTPGETIPRDIFMVSPNDGWANVVDPTYGILHWNGSTWTDEYTTEEFFIETIDGADGRQWAAGEGGTILFRGPSGSWNRVQSQFTAGSVNAVHTLSANDAWAANEDGSIARFDGTTWFTLLTKGTVNTLQDIQMVSSTDGYAVGPDSILHWNGLGWQIVGSPRAVWLSVSMTGPGEGWSMGFRETLTGPFQTVIFHAQNGAWIEVLTPFVYKIFDVAMDSPDHGWAVGGDPDDFVNPTPVLLEYTGGEWVDRNNNLPPGSPLLQKVALVPGGHEGWAVGFSRTNGPTVLHLLNGVWTLDQTAPIFGFSGLSVLSPTDVWAIGPGAYHYDGSSWQHTDLPTQSLIGSVSIIPGFGGWAVGGDGTVLRYDASTSPMLVGHVTWQGRPPQPSAGQQVPITLTLKSGVTELNYPTQTTDAGGLFTVPVSSLPNGTYNWRVKGPQHLAATGTVTLAGDPITTIDMGLMRTGDANNDNAINVTDFNILKITFGKSIGDPGYDERADFTGDQTVNIADFNLLKVNFGQGGAPPITPR